MRLYCSSSEETLRARRLLSDWADENLITEAQLERLKQETVCDLRTTNIFLRSILLLFTLICVGSAAALMFVTFLSHSPRSAEGVFFLMFSALCYAAAEAAAATGRLYRYGIEEGLAICSVGFLCAGVDALFSFHNGGQDPAEWLAPLAGALSSLWIWRRFGLWYALLAAMIFTIFLPAYWKPSAGVEHVAIAIIYAVGLVGVVALRKRHHFDPLHDTYSVAEAFLWLGVYLAMNLRLSSSDIGIASWWGGGTHAPHFAPLFYWATWVVIWCLPPVVLARGIRRKDRLVMAAGAGIAVLTLLTNKPYLGWRRQTWDPMLLGAMLVGISVSLQRWLNRGPGGIRYGFTAARLSRKDKQLMSAGSAILGLAAGQSVVPSRQSSSTDFRFGGGASGGGGASSQF